MDGTSLRIQALQITSNTSSKYQCFLLGSKTSGSLSVYQHCRNYDLIIVIVTTITSVCPLQTQQDVLLLFGKVGKAKTFQAFCTFVANPLEKQFLERF